MGLVAGTVPGANPQPRHGFLAFVAVSDEQAARLRLIEHAGVQTLTIPDRVVEIARETLGRYFAPISGMRADDNACDFLDPSRSLVRARVAERYVRLKGTKMLEVGSGFGTNVAVWQKYMEVDAYGVEPGSEGFEGGFEASRLLLEANDLEPERIIRASGESLPFPDESFDLVYSANVLEHTVDPIAVISEAVRVLRPGGTLHFEVPNHLSYFEGHYLVVMPPLVNKHILPIWLRLLGRDPAFAKTLRTEISPIWCRHVAKALSKQHNVHLVTLGEDIFLERLAKPFVFEAQGVASRLSRLIKLLQRANFGNWIGRTIVGLQGWYPMYLTLRKE